LKKPKNRKNNYSKWKN